MFINYRFQREQAKNPKEYKNYYDDFEKQILKVMAETDRKIKVSHQSSIYREVKINIMIDTM